MQTKKFTEKPETNNTINTIKLKNNKTKNLILNSGNTSAIETPSETSLKSTRGASSSSNWVSDYYRETARILKDGHLPFYVSVSIKGFKSNRKRRQINIDIVPHSGAKPMHLKSCTVNKSLKWELFRDIPKAHQNCSAWERVTYSFLQYPDTTMAGKIVTRQKYRNKTTGHSPIPIFTIGKCSCVSYDEPNGSVSVVLDFNGTDVIIHCEELMTEDKGSEWFMYRGDFKKPDEMEIV